MKCGWDFWCVLGNIAFALLVIWDVVAFFYLLSIALTTCWPGLR